jgi:gamma-glutamyl:cysteine ligase YbdK (ATP-grasp superfamily)
MATNKCLICQTRPFRSWQEQEAASVKYYDVLVEDVGSVTVQFTYTATLVNITNDGQDICVRCTQELLAKGLAKDLRLDSISAINPASEGVNENGS